MGLSVNLKLKNNYFFKKKYIYIYKIISDLHSNEKNIKNKDYIYNKNRGKEDIIFPP